MSDTIDNYKKFIGLNVSSKFAICGMPIRLDSYKTCSFGCKYCFANARKVMEFKKTLQIADLNQIQRVLDKVNSDKDLNFLETLVKSGITWHCGGMSDPFQPVNEELGITNKIIDITNRHNVSIVFSTKSDTIHDANIRNDLHSFQLSVSNINNLKNIEPNVPNIEKRFELFKYLKKNGFKVGIRIQPFIPNISNLDIVKMFEGADHFTLEGIKIVPQNREHKDFILNELGLDRKWFTQRGLLTLLPEIRLKMYEPFIEYFKQNGISYSISDNDMRVLSNNRCCCGDALVRKSSGFDTTAMIKKYGNVYGINDVFNEMELGGVECADCKCYNLFTSNRTNGCKTVADFYNERFGKKSSPFSPKFQYRREVEKSLFD